MTRVRACARARVDQTPRFDSTFSIIIIVIIVAVVVIIFIVIIFIVIIMVIIMVIMATRIRTRTARPRILEFPAAWAGAKIAPF